MIQQSSIQTDESEAYARIYRELQQSNSQDAGKRQPFVLRQN